MGIGDGDKCQLDYKLVCDGINFSKPLAGPPTTLGFGSRIGIGANQVIKTVSARINFFTLMYMLFQ